MSGRLAMSKVIYLSDSVARKEIGAEIITSQIIDFV